jgi:hypothetical protein
VAPARQAGIDHRASGAVGAEIAGVFDGENFGEPASCAVHLLLVVPTAHPHIWAGRSELIAGHWTPGLMVTTSVGTPSRPPLTGQGMVERGWLLKRNYPVLKNR